MKKKIAITLVITLILLVVGGIISTAFLSTKKEILLTAEEREVIDRFCEKYKIDVEARPLNEIIASPSIKDNLTLLHVAALIGDIEVVRILVSKGEDVNVKAGYDYTPLHGAASKGHVEVIEFLVSKGANVNAKTGDDSFTPLFSAALNNKIESVKFLVSAGADVNAKTWDGETPLDYAKRRGYTEIIEYLSALPKGESK